jgi:Beta propeller domain
MRTDLPRWPRVAIAAAAVVGLGVGVAATAVVVGLADDGDDPPPTTQRVDGPVTLISYDTCESALDELKAAALPHIGPYGLGGGQGVVTDFGDSASSSEGDVAAAPGARAQEKAAEPPAAAEDRGAASAPAEEQREHSGTNVNESGVDEPDLVKTDGRRLITIANGTLTAVDVATRQRTATVPMSGGFPSQLLLDGDRALVLTGADGVVSGTTKPMPGGDLTAGEGSRFVLVDLSGAGKIIGSLEVDGAYLDARQVGSVARVVVRSMPRLKFGYPMNEDNLDSVTESNRGVVENSTIADWLPRYSLDNGGVVSEGQLVECDAVSHPRRYTGSSLLTVLTIDLREELTTGDPMSIAADGDTVYGTGTNLYVADDHVARIDPVAGGGFAPRDQQVPPGPQQTEVYQFDISKPGRPVHVASGGVDGTLLNQYSLSEHEGNLRIATTVVDLAASNSWRSMVTVLTRHGDELALTGRVDGLGKGEQIYSVRYLGDVAYVVTFRQTDPLYTVDLSNPAAPRVTGELKITGYSAYMHPIGENRLLGVGQEATTDGVTTGLQLSLFDISGAKANRVGQFHFPNGYSEVENDPHAFLYWPDKNLVVLPVTGMRADTSGFAESGMLVLRISGDRLDQVGIIRHATPQSGIQPPPPRRALVIGNSLWSVADTDIVVSDLTTLTQQAHITL